MGDKIDLLNKRPPVPISLPPRKTLDPKCGELNIAPSKGEYTNPYLYDYTSNLNNLNIDTGLDAGILPLGRTTILGKDLKSEQD
jgi:hypothetical protein